MGHFFFLGYDITSKGMDAALGEKRYKALIIPNHLRILRASMYDYQNIEESMNQKMMISSCGDLI